MRASSCRRLPLLFLAALLTACSPAESPSSGDTPAGEETPDALAPKLLTFDGIEAELAALEGEPYLLNFWATWCAPCLAEMPELIEVSHEFRPQGLRLVTISYDVMVPIDDIEAAVHKVADFQQRLGLDAPVLVLDDPDYERIDTALRLPGPIPVTLAFDATGQEVARTEGPADAARFREMARAALGQNP